MIIRTVSNRFLISFSLGISKERLISLNFSFALFNLLFIVSLFVKKESAISVIPNPHKILSASPICASTPMEESAIKNIIFN